MNRSAALRLGLLALAAPLLLPACASRPPLTPEEREALRGKVQAFIDAPDPAARAALRADILAGEPTVADLAAAVAAGPVYAPAAEESKGWLERWVTGLDGKRRAFLLHVPEEYDPAGPPRPMMIDLHGGVSRPEPLTHDELLEMKFFWAEHCERTGAFLALPAGDRDATWWDAGGVHNVLAILREVRRGWNVDEDRVFATGFSDGGSGSFHLALSRATPFAGFIPLNGHVGVATMGGLQGHLRNLRNRPIYAVNTDQDSLYPSAALRPVFEALAGIGAPVVWREITGFRHDPSYLPAERPAIVAWMDGVRRSPFPAAVSWEGTADAPGRIDWLDVTAVTGGAGVEPFPDVNPLLRDERVRLGVQLDQGFEGPGGLVTQVVEGSLAASLGLAAGDLLLEVDGAAVPNGAMVRRMLAGKKRGDEVSVRWRRGAEEMSGTGRFPPPATEPAFDRRKPWGSLRAEWTGDLLEVEGLGIGAFEVRVDADRVAAGREIRVVVNGVEAFRGAVAPDPGYLLDRAAEDADRRLVYGGRVAIPNPTQVGE
ncbi:MAG: PDZ domain-containing protein [Planctomycetes bacterium]|nr:PDZ domain-containing protein [Planctomycetota bacterium]